MSRWVRRVPTPQEVAGRAGAWALALLAYLPALASSPGRMPSDTKLYLYLDPGRLIADAPSTWDVRQFAGWVPHQTIAYLWPSGPWFWVFEQIGAPDWVAHRLWIGTILFLGGLGVRWAARQLGLDGAGALVAGVVYQLSPYVLPYVSRTSVMLLPWAAVGWLVGLTIRACGRTRWRDAALFGLVVLTVGAVNATATALIAPAPVLWLVHAVWQRTITRRQALVTAAKLGGVSLLVSLWWIVMLVVQGRHGADVLSFSETLEAVSLTSTSTETLRGLGYWLFYVRDPYAFTTTASIPYMASGLVIFAGYALLVLGLAGLALVRWSQRRFAALLVFAGIVLAVGVHPIDDPAPLMRPLKDSALGLAIRSSTRAIPLFNMGIALGAGALVSSLAALRIRGRAVSRPWSSVVTVAAAAVVCVLALVNLPALRHRALVDPALERDQDPPAAWMAAAAALDAGSSEHRVLQLPGSEFGAFRWGYTVDPPLPGLTDKPLVTRDLLPLGSPGAMDLLYALDNRVQEGTLDVDALAPVARFLGVDTIWLADDLAFDRFRTPRPEIVSATFRGGIEGLGQPVPYGTPEVNVPLVPMVDELMLSDPRIGTPLPAVELVPVDAPQAIVRASAEVVVLAGSGDGIVDASAAGLLDGDEAVIYAADVDGETRAQLPPGTPVIVTDSHRDRAAQWRSSQDVTGFTESGGPDADVTTVDDADQRLAVFPQATGEEHQTVAVLDGDLRVAASSYGEPFAYRPEHRAAMAVDGDPSTAWIVGERGEPVGESIRVTPQDGDAGPLVLLQSQDPTSNRRITRVSVRRGAEPAVAIHLTDASWSAPGQALPFSLDDEVTITIDAVEPVPGGADSGPSGVGFAELGPVATEVVRLPTDAWSLAAADTPLSIVLRREHVRETNRWRDDPEPSLVRRVDLPMERTFAVTVTLRLDTRASDELLAAWNGLSGVALADRRLTGVASAAGRFAVDGDLSTEWTTPFGQSVGASVTLPMRPGAVGAFSLVQRVDEHHSPITRLHLRLPGFAGEVEVPAPDADGRSTITLPGGAGAREVAAGDSMTVTITAVHDRTTVDRRYGEVVGLPASITELEGLPIAEPVSSPAVTPPQSCRDDLVQIDGQPLPLGLSEDDVARLVAGQSVEVAICDGVPAPVLPAGTHRITSTPGGRTGVDVDRIVLDSSPDGSDVVGTGAPSQPAVAVERTRTERTATVGACPDGCWMILGEGFNTAWEARLADGESLGAPTQISGGFNGWWLPPSTSERTVTMTWTPQASLNIALLLAALGVVACIALALLDRREREPLIAVDPPVITAPWMRTSRRAAIGAAVTLIVAGLLVSSPGWALVGAGLGAVAVALRRSAWLPWSAALLAGILGTIVLRRELAQRYIVDAAWPGRFEDLHRAGMFVVVLVLAGCLFDPAGAEPVREEDVVDPDGVPAPVEG